MDSKKMTIKALCSNIIFDKKINSFKSFIVLLDYRLCHYAYIKKHIGIRLFLFKIGGEIIKTVLNIDAQISYKAELGQSIKLPHSAQGVIISSKARIGDNVVIMHQVTLGVNENKSEDDRCIVVGDDCFLGTGCKIISSKIGSNCKVGPNTVIVKDIPDNTLCYLESVVREEYYA